jgi:ferritin-like metal-binding protein YciE
MHLGTYLGIVHESEQQLVQAFKKVGKKHGKEPDILHICQKLASWSENHVKGLKKFVEKYNEKKSDEPDRLSKDLFSEPRSGSLALLRDLHDVWLLVQEVELCWKVILQAAQALRDKDLEALCQQSNDENDRQAAWLLTRIKQAAPQVLVVPE